MNFVGHAFVDWDDTIAENIRYFHHAEAESARIIAGATGAAPSVVRQRGQELDLIVARRMGLVRESLTVAWTDCYREFCAQTGTPLRQEVLEAISAACRFPYEVRQTLIPGAAEALQWLAAAGFEITIWTAGDDSVQSRKIRESGLEPLIHRKSIVPDKTPDRLLTALDGRVPERSFVVGNSAHSDIRPALTLGLPAYHVEVETWAYDHQYRVDAANPNYYRLNRITDLPPLLSERFRRTG